MGANNDTSPVLRSIKMDVPNFDGTNPQGWIFRVEEFFDFHNTADHEVANNFFPYGRLRNSVVLVDERE